MYSWSENHDKNVEIFIFIWFSATKWSNKWQDLEILYHICLLFFGQLTCLILMPGSNFNHCDRQWSCDLPRHDKTSSPYPRQLVYLIAGCGRSVCRVSILSTPVRRQILLHRRPHPCWCLFQGQLRLLVLLQHQSLRHDGRPLPCHHKAFAVHVLHDERNCLGNDYYGLDWPISTLLFAFHLHLQSQSDIYHVRGNIPSAHFPDSAPRYLCRCDLSSPSHCLESQPPDTGTDFSSSPQPCYEHEWTEHPATCSIQSATQEFHRFDHIGDDRLQYHVPRRELPLSLLSH